MSGTPDPAAELVALAREAEATLKAQRRYFDCSPGGPDKARLLQEARDWERRLLVHAREVLDRAAAPGLFDQPGGS